ncbi:MAG: DUF2167 domain-containing protein, partial [Phycisphaerales bacterium]
SVLIMNAVAPIESIDEVRKVTPTILNAVHFVPGRRYEDFVDGTDRTAEYGITGLIVGAAATKSGLLKGLWLGILAFKKLIIGGVVAVGALVMSIIRGGPADAASK